MSHDKPTDPLNHAAGNRPNADALPDEGMIHEWLDGQLDETQAARLEALVKTSPEFAAQVAEARGLIAGSSRVLLALDGVPAGVLPGVDAGAAPETAATAIRGPSWRRWGAAAALLMVGVTGVVVANREPAVRESVLAQADDSPSSREVAAMEPAPAPMAPVASANRQAAPAEDAVGRARSADSLVSPATRVGERVAADEALRPSIAPMADSAIEAARKVAVGAVSPATRSSIAGGTVQEVQQLPVAALANSVRRASGSREDPLAMVAGAPAAAAAAAAESEASNSPADFPSTLPPNDLAYAVQRVSCTPVCTQRRYEIARDGRVRLHTRGSLLGAAEIDSGGVVTSATLASVAGLVDSLGLAELPGMVGLDGGRCRSVGALRESLRVEFVVDGQWRRVMGLPWCSDGSHPLDQVARAVEAAVTAALAEGS
jgi:hypothetical protein